MRVVKKMSTDEYISRCKKAHGDKYDYSKTIYVSGKEKVEVICPLEGHGSFFVVAAPHYQRFRGCPTCFKNNRGKKKRTKQEDFIKKAKSIHGDKYDYSLVEYVTAHVNVKIKCNYHDYIFEQSANNHIHKTKPKGCPKCKFEKISSLTRHTKEQFIEKAKKTHGNRYEYSLVKYVNEITPVEIICQEHGIFKQRPSNHINGANCNKCIFKYDKLNKDEFIFEAKKVHGDKYNYENINFVDMKTRVNILCEKHGEFLQFPKRHLKGVDCKRCKTRLLDQDTIIERFKEVHGETYDYSLVNYKGGRYGVDIICKEHGVFKQSPEAHAKGCGCPSCFKASKGELMLEKIFNDYLVDFEKQKGFEDLRHKSPLKFDFYLPKYNLLIEYDGLQHRKPIKMFGGEEAFKIQKMIDDIKTEYTIKNNIKLLRLNNTRVDKIKKFLWDNITDIMSKIEEEYKQKINYA